MKLVIQLTFAVFFLVLAACSKSNQDVVIRSSGDLFTNGPGVSGNVHKDNKIFFPLKNIKNGQTYTLRVEIGQARLLSDGTPSIGGTLSRDGFLSVDIYESEDAYRNSATAIASAVPASFPYDYVYEAKSFRAASLGDYLAVVSGESHSTPGLQFFFDIRIMSADQSVLTSFDTTTITDSLVSAGVVTIIGPGSLNIFSGSSITSQGTYSINLTSNSTTTFGYPQLFIYDDASLSLGSLLYSSYTTSADFIVTKFDIATGISSTLPTDPNNTLASGMTITNIGFSDRGPFIVVKGIISASTYSLTVGSVTASP